MSSLDLFKVPAGELIYYDSALDRTAEERAERCVRWVKSFLLTNDQVSIHQDRCCVYAKTVKDIEFYARDKFNALVSESNLKRYVQDVSQQRGKALDGKKRLH